MEYSKEDGIFRKIGRKDEKLGGRVEVEHLFDAHYSVSRPRLRVIRVCGGVRGRGRWVTSPGAFTLRLATLLSAVRHGG